MSADGKWGDLPARVTSGVVMLVLGAFAIWQGGLIFHVVMAAVAGLMIWELIRMMDPEKPSAAFQNGLLAAAVVMSLGFIPSTFFVPVLVAPAFVALSAIKKDRLIFVLYAASLMLAVFGFLLLRETAGLTWVLWMIAVVVMTDIAGYFAGRILGGPKFWPSISPKKTWSGTAAGWIAAALIGLVMAGPGLALVSVAVSFASQLGDIAESAIKRRSGIKDSSNLIPGHGGVLDRFDGMMAAALVVLIVSTVVGLPHHPG